ncbi:MULTISPECIES: hypothetical protein [unclassified Micromonospora]|uniref:hypothetical protein n=1 Tax=unclassified Micromonospora TaxID=2617518 RepID=UPI001C601F90|nr:hypothetical protein [Micromonospora sp. RL09-050-HVF-A]MBW4700482.1 hypothetical protein [Micromonospora sp. RL09-050-HVF-A]
MAGETLSCGRDHLSDVLRFDQYGAYDGSDSWALTMGSLTGPAQVSMTELHEALHHELQRSSGWGLLATGAGILARSGFRRHTLREVFLRLVDQSRDSHETYATTLSAIVTGVDAARELLVGNREYLAYLDRGLALVDVAGDWPWQFRISAIDAVLRVCMRPAMSLDLVHRGFRQLASDDVAAGRDSPDRRLAVFEQTGGPQSWTQLFAAVRAEFPERGGDDGAARPRAGSPGFERLRQFEEEVLGPRCHAHVCEVLDRAGLGSVGSHQQSALATAYRDAVAEVDPETAALITVARERLAAHEDGLELHRQRVLLRAPLTAEFASVAESAGGEDHVCGLWLDGAVAKGQFTFGEQAVPERFAAIASVSGATIRLGLLPDGATPTQCQGMVANRPLLALTTHHTLARHGDLLAMLQTVEPVFVLMDLPVERHVAQWTASGILVRTATRDIGDVTLLMLAVTRNHPFRFLCIGTPAGMYLLTDRLRRRHPGQVVLEPTLLEEHPAATGFAVDFVLNAWHLLKQGGPT